VDTRAGAETALVGFVDLLAGFNLEGEVLDPDLVLVVLAGVRRAEPKVLLAEAKVNNLLRAAVARDADVLLEAERPKNLKVESEGAPDVADAEIDVLDPARWNSSACASRCSPSFGGIYRN